MRPPWLWPSTVMLAPGQTLWMLASSLLRAATSWLIDPLWLPFLVLKLLHPMPKTPNDCGLELHLV
jgi:hypothetical protein